MNNNLQESIDLSKFIEHAHRLQSKYGHMVAYPEELFDIVKLMYHPVSGAIIGIVISTSSEKTNDNKFRIKLKDSNNQFVYGTLKCEELMKFDNLGVLRHKFFSFHFEADHNQEQFYTFRLDYDPKAPTPLHAHDFTDKTQSVHLSYPANVSLNLNMIDYCTVLQILSYYFLHVDKYPLTHGNEYNKLIENTRSIYDEQR